MIASLQGKVHGSGRDFIILDVNGVGYQVFTPEPHLAPPESELSLHTVLVVRDDALTLYGFVDFASCELFRNLMKISGIGPRLALSVLTTMSPDNLRQAIQSERADLITRVPGVGRKSAEKIVLEMRDKLGEVPVGIVAAAFSDADTEVMDALTALGYSLVEAQAALQALPADTPDDVEARLRLALQYFA